MMTYLEKDGKVSCLHYTLPVDFSSMHSVIEMLMMAKYFYPHWEQVYGVTVPRSVMKKIFGTDEYKEWEKTATLAAEPPTILGLKLRQDVSLLDDAVVLVDEKGCDLCVIYLDAQENTDA